VEARLLLWPLLVTLFLLNFAVQRHGYYALPLLAPGAILLASAAVGAFEEYAENGTPAWWRWTARLAVLAVVTLFAVVASKETGASLIISLLDALSYLVILVIATRMRDTTYSLRSLVISMSAAAFMMSATQFSWSDQRTHRVMAALAAKEHVTPETTLIALGVSDELLLYYTKHKVIPCGTRDEVLKQLENSPGRTAVVVVADKQRPLLAAPIEVTHLGGFGDEEVVAARLP
jgi:4-amino-4-deoxy-L-arabinose transferase-like glycosyltransferase